MVYLQFAHVAADWVIKLGLSGGWKPVP